MHNQGDLELLTLWIVGKGGKCHKKNHHFDCSLYSIHSIDMTDLTIESNENREKRFAYLVARVFQNKTLFYSKATAIEQLSSCIDMFHIKFFWELTAGISNDILNWNDPQKICFYWKSCQQFGVPNFWIYQWRLIRSLFVLNVLL